MAAATPNINQTSVSHHARRRSVQSYIGPVLIYAALIVLSILFLIPFYIIFRNALMTQAQITSFDWVWLPIPPQFGNFAELFNDPSAPMATGLRNSAIIAIVQTFGQMFIASLAGYGLARIPFRYSNQVFYAMLITLMIPGAVTFVPNYVIVASFGWVNTYQGLIIPGLFNTFAAFLFRQFYIDFPQDIEDAGWVDGLGYWGIYRYLLLPNSIGILVALGAITFIASWNAFLWPLIIGQTPKWWTVQVVLSTFLTAQTINLPALFMGAAVAVIPLIIIFLIMQRYIVEGVALSGVKA
ncbi:MAG TPA: carbohydrate ABC transporter permease [Roseiflexaceae bacterium]|jgi:multiple sugar transport system permease protein|nr:carbohydrate ABC transporter permease [Roseiflexaceae bacterium]